MRFDTPSGPLDVRIRNLTIAGWTGRDTDAVAHHVEELSRIGVAPPSATPLFYRVSPSLLTQEAEIAVLGSETSGEVEPLLLRIGERLWLGLGSDHTDRGLETHSIAHSKQVCPKPVARRIVPLPGPAQLDGLTLTAWLTEESGRSLYQQGTLSQIRPLADLVAAAPLGPGDAMLCGTVPAMGGVRGGAAFAAELGLAEGPPIRLDYAVRTLPVVS